MLIKLTFRIVGPILIAFGSFLIVSGGARSLLLFCRFGESLRGWQAEIVSQVTDPSTYSAVKFTAGAKSSIYMVVLYFRCYNPAAGILESSIGGNDIEFCLELFSTLVRKDWQPMSLKLSVDPDTVTQLPIEAFDGRPMKEPLQSLQQQWEELLYQH